MPDTIREGWFRETYAGRQWMASDKMAASKQSVRSRCVVVTGRTAQDVTRLLREPTGEDMARAARAIHGLLPAISQEEAWEDAAEMFARAAIAAYRSPEEADHV